MNEVSTETDGCVGCAYLIREKRKTWNKYITLKAKYDEIVKVKRSKGIYIQCIISILLAQIAGKTRLMFQISVVSLLRGGFVALPA